MMMSGFDNDRENASPLTEREVVWRDRYNMLESHGYCLRQRYKPDWKPSWLTTKRPPLLHDDYKPNRSTMTIDAVRVSDGRRVFLKRIPTSSLELTIHRFLSDEERLKDPCNHTVPLLGDFLEDEDPSFTYIAMPLLRPFYFPDFFSVDEVTEFVKQVLEGIVYMHNVNIAHRDCSILNIMMDADAMYPRGFHPTNMHTDATAYRTAHPKHRRDVRSIKYYFIDFGISSMFGPDDKDRNVVGADGQDDTVPELSEIKPYDPFCVDIFIIGNLFRKSFFEKYENLAFLEPLIDDMTQRSPMARCLAPEAVKLFNDILSQQTPYSLRWRLVPKSLGKVSRFWLDVDSITRETVFLAKRAISSSSEGAIHFLQGHLRPSKNARGS